MSIEINKNNSGLQPYAPFEFTDQFQRKILFSGISKLEYLAMQIYAHSMAHEYDTPKYSSLDAKDFADLSIEFAKEFFEVFDTIKTIDTIEKP